MNVKAVVRKQKIQRVDRAAEATVDVNLPKQGWIATMRDALGMSGAKLGKRIGVTRAAIAQAERNERAGAITLRQMRKIAEGMGGTFVYAIVPKDSIHSEIRRHAYQKAEALVKRVDSHMALEQQSLPPDGVRAKIVQTAEDLIRDMPSDFWDQ